MGATRSLRRFALLAAFALAGAGVTRVAPGVVLSTDAGNGADSFVQLGNATGNFGNDANVTVKYDGSNTGGTNRKGYLRFDLSSLAGAINEAGLVLTVSTNNGGGTPANPNPQNFTFNVYGLNDNATAGNGFLGEDWAETAINWNNAPANITSGAGAGNAVQTGAGTADGGQATLLGSFSVTSADVPGTQVIALTGGPGSSLVNFLNANNDADDDTATLILTRTGWTSGGGTPAPSQGSSNSAFASGEAANLAQRPQLYINEPVPEPGAVGALAALAATLLLRRRRCSPGSRSA